MVTRRKDINMERQQVRRQNDNKTDWAQVRHQGQMSFAFLDFFFFFFFLPLVVILIIVSPITFHFFYIEFIISGTLDHIRQVPRLTVGVGWGP